MATSFETIIDKFLGKITDDMYLELTYEDTLRDAKQFLLDAIPYFEFPRFQLYNYDEEEKSLITDNIHEIYCFFPTKETFKTCFITHAPFLLTENRQNIKQDESVNVDLLELLSTLEA